MQTNPNLNIQTLIFYLSQLFERMAYYGLRAILILYMITELSVERLEALSIYGWIVRLHTKVEYFRANDSSGILFFATIYGKKKI